MIIVAAFAAFLIYMFFKRMARRRNGELMEERPYRFDMDSRRSNSGWKGGF